MNDEVCQQPVCEYNNIPFTADEVFNVAKNQSNILYCVLVNLVLTILTWFIPAGLSIAAQFVSLAISIGMIVFLVKLRNSMKKNVVMTILVCFLMLIPLINLLVLISHVVSATKLLRSAGLKVGLMGVSSADLAVFRERNRSIY